MARPRKNDAIPPTPERILVAAEQVFGEVGFSSARLATIGEKAGITRASLLHHFPSKIVLYEAVVRRALDEIQRRLVVSVDLTAPFESQLIVITEALTAFGHERAGLAGVLLRELMKPESQRTTSRELGRLVDRVTSMLKVLGADHIPEDMPVREAVLLLISGFLVRISSGADLWEGPDQTVWLTRALFRGAATLSSEA